MEFLFLNGSFTVNPKLMSRVRAQQNKNFRKWYEI